MTTELRVLGEWQSAIVIGCIADTTGKEGSNCNCQCVYEYKTNCSTQHVSLFKNDKNVQMQLQV